MNSTRAEKFSRAQREIARKEGLLSFYRHQLKKFYKVGIGNKTEFGTVVTETLIDATKRRLSEIGDF